VLPVELEVVDRAVVAVVELGEAVDEAETVVPAGSGPCSQPVTNGENASAVAVEATTITNLRHAECVLIMSPSRCRLLVAGKTVAGAAPLGLGP
jgi:hypothetical protein